MTGIAPEPGVIRRRARGADGTLDEALDAELSAGLARAVEETGAYSGVVYLRSHDRRSLVLTKVAGLSVTLLDAWQRVAVTRPLPVCEAYRTGRMVFVADADEMSRRFPQLAIGMPYAFGSASVPIRAGGETFGVLAVLWPAAPGRRLPSSRRRRLRAAGMRVAAVLADRAAVGAPVEYDGPPTSAPLGEPTLSPMRVGSFDWNVDTGAFLADGELCAMFGVDPVRFDGRAATLAARIVSGGGREFREAARRAVETGRVLAWRVHVQVPDGAKRLLEMWGRVPDQTGSRHLVGVVLDLGFGAAAAEAVERLREGVFALDPHGRITYANRILQSMLDVRLEDVLGRTPWEAFPWLADPTYEDRYRAAMVSQHPGSFLVHTPHNTWLAISLFPDPYGITGKVVPVGPPPDAEERAAAEPAAARGAGHPIAGPASHRPAPARLGAIYHVLQMAGALTEAVSMDEVCEVVVDQILPAFGAQELAVYLIQDRRMHLVREHGYPEGFLDQFEGVSTDASLPGVETLTRGAPIFFTSVADLVSAYPDIALDEMRSWAFLPLIASDRPVGSCILGFDHEHEFTVEERSVLTALSGLIAQALERARLYDAEFALARGLQHALLPHRLPTLPHLEVAARYLPGTQGMEIGGDWYDVIDTEGTVALVIGDVEGHSVAAAATMGQLRSAVRAFATAEQGPGEVLCRTNRLLADLDPGLFASCCYLELDPHSGRLHAARAGHPPPLLREPDGYTRTLDLEGGAVLGVDRDSDYPVTALSLRAGSLIALYTDGLVEDVGRDIDHGIERLRRWLSRTPDGAVPDVADRLVRDAGRVTERADDVAVLLTRWTGAQANGHRPGGDHDGHGGRNGDGHGGRNGGRDR
jgi:serine phosphatase RsbU (regulator of sigma subunit)/PAS domain-containing protein